MPFIRQTRDKRGFEHTYVMHNGRPGSGPARPRVLYVFRSPGNLRVGRKALDAEVREALEHTHPDLAFDWNALTREAVVSRQEPPPRQAKGPRTGRPQQSQPAAPPPAPAAEILPDDQTLLGQTLGAAHAARLRARFSEISQRIVRRARTPEERDGWLERARPLNPDAWVDEASIRAQVANAEAELSRLAAELPSRRRGRRGGRNRTEGRHEMAGSDASGIMAESDERHENANETSMDRPSGASDTGSDAGLSAADPEAPGIPGDD